MTEGGSFGEDAFSDPVVSPRLSGFLSSAEFTVFLYDNDFIISGGGSERTSERKQ